MNQERVIWIDYAKAKAIFCVVLLHAGVPDPYREIIYTSVIPLFFFMSGIFSSTDKYISILNFIKLKASKTLIPYFWFNLITYLFWLFIGRKYGLDSSNQTDVLSPLFGILAGRSDLMIHYVPLWFLASLFSVELINYLFFRNCKSIKYQISILTLFLLAAYINYKFNPYKLPWGIDIALSMIVFYKAGFTLRNLLNININKFSLLLLVILSLGFVLYITQFNVEVNVHSNFYGNYLLFIIGAISGIIFYFSFCKLMQITFKPLKIILFIGQNTLIILALHLISLSVFKAFLMFILKIDFSLYEHSLIYSIVASIFSILLLMPVIIIINKYFPFIIGNKKTAEFTYLFKS